MQLSSQARKAVAAGLALSTILWSSLAFVPSIASAAVHSDGCVVLSGGIVWLISGGVRRGFTSAEVFASSGYNFSQVVSASAEDAALPVGPIMTYADGTLVKGPSDPLVYLVTGGQKRGFTSGAVFTGRGYSFANIQSAPANTFADLPVGTVINDTNSAHGAGVLVVSNGTIWLMTANGRMGFPSLAVFNSYGYNLKNVVAANASDLASGDQGPVVARAACTGGGTTTPPPTSGSFSVSLASDTPVATSLVSDTTNGGQALAPIAKFNFVGGASGATITTVNLHRVGVASDSIINNAYLYDGMTRLAQMQSVSAGVLSFVNSAGLFTVSPNTVRAITVKMDLASSAAAGQTIGLSFTGASDITATGNVNPTGSFPISGNQMTVAKVTDLGKLTVANVSPTGAVNVDPGQTQYEVWRFSLQAANQNLKVTSLAFTNIGSASGNQLQNFKLMNGGVQLGNTVAQQDGNRMVSFDLSGSPLAITSGVTLQLSLRADIIGGSTLTYQFSFQNSSDIQVTDTQYGVALFPGGGTTFTVVKAGGATTINSGTLSVSKTSDSPTGSIAVNGTNVTLAKFQFTANGEASKVTTLTITANATSSHTIKNLKIFANGVQVGTTTSSLVGDNATTAAYNMGNSLVVVPGTATYVTVVGDLTGTTISTDTVSITLKQGSSNSQGQTSLTTGNAPAADIAANTLTISGSTLSGVANPALAAATVAKGSTQQTIGSFLLTAGAAEGVQLNSVVIKDENSAGNANGSNGLGNAFNNIKLFQGSTQLGTTSVNPSTTAGTTITFNISPNVLIPANGSIQLDVRADVLSGATWTTGDKVAMTTATSGVGASTTTSISLTALANGQGITLATAGTVTVSLDGSSPSTSQQLVMGATANTLGVWQFQANNVENLNVNQVIVNSTSTAGGDFQNLKLMVNGAAVATVPSLSAATNGSATFGSAATTLFTVPANGFVRVTLVADATNSTNATGATSSTFNLQTPASITGASTNQVIITGASSGNFATLANASATYTSQASLTYKTKIVATNVAVPSNTTNTRQANDTIFTMNLAANSGYQVAFRAAAFQSADTSTSAFTGALSTATNWTVVAGHNGVFSTDSSTMLEGAGAQKYASGTTTVAGDGMKDTWTSTDFSGYNGVAFWVKEANSSNALDITLTGATGTYALSGVTTVGVWQLVVVPFSGNFTANLNAITAFQAVFHGTPAVAGTDTFEIDAISFYKDFIKANVNGTALKGQAALTLKDAVSGTTFGTSFLNASSLTASTTGTAYFFPISEFDISAGGNRNLSLIADTTTLLNATGNSFAVNVNLGTSSSSVTAPGDVVWYDGKVAQSSGAGASTGNSAYWVDTQPNPVQGASRTY